MMFKLFHKAVYPREWPDKKVADIKLQSLLQNGHLKLPKQTIIILYDPQLFTASQKSYLLGMFKPEDKHVIYLNSHTALGQQVKRELNLPEDNLLLYQKQPDISNLLVEPLFFTNQVVSELNFLLIQDIACAISNHADLVTN